MGEGTAATKPIISYYGGKQNLSPKIIPYIPRHTVYAEVFAGGAALLFMKPQPTVISSNYREIINDIDKRLINFYQQTKLNGIELISQLEATLYSEAMHRDSYNMDTGSKMQNAVNYFVNIEQSFANKLNGGWGWAIKSGNPAVEYRNKINRLPQYINRLQNIQISCTNAIKCIKDWDSPQTFFYCDPPYPGTAQGHYKGYTKENFKKLVDVLENIQGSMILSCYYFDGLQVPDEWQRVDIATRMSAVLNSNNNRRIETFYIKQSEKPDADIQELYDSGKYDCFQGNKRQRLFDFAKNT